jgi:hypothetical protein
MKKVFASVAHICEPKGNISSTFFEHRKLTKLTAVN